MAGQERDLVQEYRNHLDAKHEYERAHPWIRVPSLSEWFTRPLKDLPLRVPTPPFTEGPQAETPTATGATSVAVEHTDKAVHLISDAFGVRIDLSLTPAEAATLADALTDAAAAVDWAQMAPDEQHEWVVIHEGPLPFGDATYLLSYCQDCGSVKHDCLSAGKSLPQYPTYTTRDALAISTCPPCYPCTCQTPY